MKHSVKQICAIVVLGVTLSFTAFSRPIPPPPIHEPYIPPPFTATQLLGVVLHVISSLIP